MSRFVSTCASFSEGQCLLLFCFFPKLCLLSCPTQLASATFSKTPLEGTFPVFFFSVGFFLVPLWQRLRTFLHSYSPVVVSFFSEFMLAFASVNVSPMYLHIRFS
jgi:hypothetical protein